MATRYSVLCPSQPQESESVLTLDQAWDVCYDLAEEFGYAEVRDPNGDYIGDCGNPASFFNWFNMTDIELKKAQKEVMTNHQVDSLCKLIDGKLSRVTCVDSKGIVTKKIIIEYQDD